MKDQIKEMDLELERYHKNNANLELRISDPNLKLDGLNRELVSQRKKLNDADNMMKRFRTDLHEAIQHIQEPKQLKDSVKYLFQKYVTQQVQTTGLEVDIEREYNRQREYLERSVASLRKKLNKDSELHRADNIRILQENVSLIREINELRREIKTLKQQQQKKDLMVSKKPS